MSRITRVSVEALDLPMEEPFEISLGTQHEARNVLVEIETESGAVGYGEGSPIAPVTGETQAAALAVAKAAATLLEGEDVADYRRLVETTRKSFPGMVSALFAVETALLDTYCREREIPLASLFGGGTRPVTTDITIPILSPQKAASTASRAIEHGFEHLKIKTGNDVDEDIDRVAAIADVAEGAELKVDANQGWSVKETVAFASEIDRRGIELALIEQPVRKDDIAGLSLARDSVHVPIAADESVFTPADALRVVREDAADVLNVKLGKSGPLAAAEIVAIAKAANLELMVGCMLESAIGIHTSAHLVAGTGAFSYVDLDGNLLLEDDVVQTQYGPTIEITGSGHGVTPER
ncbi:dipeptide epimerase [Haloprofundus marisrubri]|uniref:Dipeptide epimerase n=1 Tax=Haloprofundus marisrubri TaxID=1514971 RepID=A0A0W1R3A4_9EURY|nr:dipeptide epimerase [Haloprofundus marisrubri]KTG07697.1 dipeptide epimerase [Haloprofundus marisrubri]